MTLRLVLRSLAARPIRFLVLACGFGFGIAVMAALLGVGEVVLEQAQNPALGGGGDVALVGASGTVDHARFVLSSVLGASPLAERIRVASPSVTEALFLVQENGVTPLRARGGIPSLERALDDPETSSVAAWTDSTADLAWVAPDPTEVLRSMDRFHPIPDVPTRAESWAEWLYFNGRSPDGAVRFYLTFLAGPRSRDGMRSGWVRLQLSRGRHTASFARSAAIPVAALAPDQEAIEIAGNRVGLADLRYTIDLDLAAEDGGRRARGRIVLDAVPGRSVPPIELHGAGGWVSGYVVPVLGGAMGGAIDVDGKTIPLDGFLGYHDHNWGFWKGVTWQWGQVAKGDLSFVYGRIRPPPDAADPERVPGLLAVIGPEGPLAFARGVTIDEHDAPGESRPQSVLVRAAEGDLDVTLELRVADAIRTRIAGSLGSVTGPVTFLQLRGLYRVRGTVGGRAIDFEEPGSAETFLGE